MTAGGTLLVILALTSVNAMLAKANSKNHGKNLLSFKNRANSSVVLRNLTIGIVYLLYP